MSIFSELANVKAADVKEPTPLPIGHYTGQFTGLAKEHKSKANVALQFPLRLLQAEDDVDQEALATAGGLPDKELVYNFWMSENARFMFTNFAKSLGYSDQLSLLEIANKIGEEAPAFLIEVQHEPMQTRDGQPVLDGEGNPKMRMVLNNIVGKP